MENFQEEKERKECRGLTVRAADGDFSQHEFNEFAKSCDHRAKERTPNPSRTSTNCDVFDCAFVSCL